MKFAQRVSYLKQSLTRKLFDLAQTIPDAIDLTLGDPDVLPPKEIRDAACSAIIEGRTRYSQNAGLLECRNILAKFNATLFKREISAQEIMLTCGGMEALYLALSSLVESGDEVIIPGPYWVNYKQMTQICGATPVIVPTRESDNFAISVDALAKAVSSNTKVLILNSPNNPTGRIIPGKILDGIADFAIENNLFVISDEVYRSLIYNGQNHESIWTRPGMRERCAVVDSMSKRFSMTGYRLGSIIAPEELITVMTRLQENVAACAPLPSQYAAINGYGEGVDAAYLLEEFTARRSIVLKSFADMPKLSLSGIDGTFYAFVNIGKTGLKSFDFAMKLLECQSVAVVPGVTYGDDYDDYIRIAFTVNKKMLSLAMNRLREFAEHL